MKTQSPQWLKDEERETKLAQLARIELDVRTCQKCGSPYHSPHKCFFCGDFDPDHAEEKEEKKYALTECKGCVLEPILAVESESDGTMTIWGYDRECESCVRMTGVPQDKYQPRKERECTQATSARNVVKT